MTHHPVHLFGFRTPEHPNNLLLSLTSLRGGTTKQSRNNTCLFTCSDCEHLNTRTILLLSLASLRGTKQSSHNTHLFTCSDCEHLNTRTIWLFPLPSLCYIPILRGEEARRSNLVTTPACSPVRIVNT